MQRTFLTISLLTLVPASLVYGQNPTPSITSVLDPYTAATKLSPGGQAIITGTNLGTNPQVTVGGKNAFNLVPPNNTSQMTIEIPVDAALGSANLIITLGTGATSAPFPITLVQYAPVLINSTSGALISPKHQSGSIVTAGNPAAPGETIIVSAIGLGPTNPAVPTGTAPAANAPTTVTPTVSLGGNILTGVSAALVPGQALIAIYQVTFAVPQGQNTSGYPVSLSIGGVTSNNLQLFVGPAPTGPVITTVTDPYLSKNALSPGSLAVVTGVNLGASPQVTVGGKAAFIVAPPQNGGQMTIEIPVDAPLGQAPVIVTAGAGANSPPFNIMLTQYAPVLIFSTSGALISPSHQKGGAAVTAANPAVPNETIVIYAIGLGPTNPVVPTGVSAPANPPASTTSLPTVGGAGGFFTDVTAGLVPGQVGIYQITFVVPPGTPAGNRMATLMIGGAGSGNFLTLPVAAFNGPVINSLGNNYSYLVRGLPNYGIAQGSIFDIFGTTLANASTPLQSFPLSTSLQGVTVDITVNSAVTHALLYYVTPGQIGAILPSVTPVGDGTIIVTNNGQASLAAPIHVVQSAFGILTLNGAGTGPAAAFDAGTNYLGFNNALNPGDYFILWGTGVGPSSGSEAVLQTPADLTGVPFSIEVGGLPAQLFYHGRSQYPGLDQVIGIVPAGVQPGCWVSVVTRSGNIVSNFASLPIAATGRTCSDASLGVTPTQIQTLLGMSAFNLGSIKLQKLTSTASGSGGTQTTVTDSAQAQFFRITTAAFNSNADVGPSLGSCKVVSGSTNNLGSGGDQTSPLDAGSVINVAGPNGKVALNYQTNSAKYGATITPAIFIPPAGGTFTFDNGTGGAGVGAFTAGDVLGGPLLAWTNQGTISTVNRSAGVTVSWTGGNANSFVQIGGTSLAGAASAQFACSVNASAGQFTIPAPVLITLPASIPQTFPSASTLTVSQQTFAQPFTAPKLDLGFSNAVVAYSIPVIYQ